METTEQVESRTEKWNRRAEEIKELQKVRTRLTEEQTKEVLLGWQESEEGMAALHLLGILGEQVPISNWERNGVKKSFLFTVLGFQVAELGIDVTERRVRKLEDDEWEEMVVQFYAKDRARTKLIIEHIAMYIDVYAG